MGFTQILGVDFTDYFALLMSDMIMKIMIILYLIFELHTKLVDIEGAFLYGYLETSVYMEHIEGYGSLADHCLKLDKSIYGLV